jgi:hypothetical protein
MAIWALPPTPTGVVVVQDSTVLAVVTIAAPGQPVGPVEEQVNAPPFEPAPVLVGVPAATVTPAVLIVSINVTVASVAAPP